MRIGIVGAGFIGRAIAQLAVDNGHEAMVSNSRGPDTLASIPSGIGAAVGTVGEAIAFGDAVAVAIPFNAIGTLPAGALAGRIVIDPNNYYPERDGRIAALDERRTTTSQMVAQQLPGSRVVKAFNAILARDLVKAGRMPDGQGRRALPIAGDDPDAKRVVAGLHEEFGFEVVDAGSLANSWRFERAKPCLLPPLAGRRPAPRIGSGGARRGGDRGLLARLGRHIS